MPPRKSGESLQSQCIKRVAWMVTPLIALEDQQYVREICDHIGASVGHLVRGRLAEHVAELCANLNPGGAANPELIAGIVNFVFALNCTNVNLKPLNAMSIQLAEDTYSSFVPPLVSSLKTAKSAATLTVLNLSSIYGKGARKSSKPTAVGPTRQLPIVDDEVMLAIGRHCHSLEHLDISYNRDVTGRGLGYLVPKKEDGGGGGGGGGGSDDPHRGCPNLLRLHMFDTLVNQKDVAEVVKHFPDLEYLGYKETARVIKNIHATAIAKGQPVPKLKFTHINNMGSKNRKVSADALRCRKPIMNAIVEVLPQLRNIKARVTDGDVEGLIPAQNLAQVELLYNAGARDSPQYGMTSLLEARGAGLTSVALVSKMLSVMNVKVIAENCPNLSQLWLRCNHFTNPDLSNAPEFSPTIEHSYLKKLAVLYLRVGENNYNTCKLQPYVFHYVLRNAGDTLRELILAARTSTLTDPFMRSLVTRHGLHGLEKLLVVVPGLNDIGGALDLTADFASFAIDCLPRLRKIGNLISWRVGRDDLFVLESDCTMTNYDLEIVCRKMVMR